VTHLRKAMLEELQRRNLSQNTARIYASLANEVSCLKAGNRWNPAVRAAGFRVRQPSTGKPNRAGSNLPRDHCRCPVPACDDAWRWFTAKRFCGNGFALVRSAERFSSSARTVIADTATAVPHAAGKPDASSGGPPTGATNRAPKDGSIIAIRQREYRCRRRQAQPRVTDHGSLSIVPPSCPSPAHAEGPTATEATGSPTLSQRKRS
jgi:hypothetical protein